LPTIAPRATQVPLPKNNPQQKKKKKKKKSAKVYDLVELTG
jgi:hypothetical protein